MYDNARLYVQKFRVQVSLSCQNRQAKLNGLLWYKVLIYRETFQIRAGTRTIGSN